MKRLPTVEGCSDHNCIFGHPGGMGTNGGCACEKDIRGHTMRVRFIKNIRAYNDLIAIQADEITKIRAAWQKQMDYSRELEDSLRSINTSGDEKHG